MTKLSKEEIEKRGNRLQQKALKSVAKTEQLNIRMEEKNIFRLYSLAKNRKKPVGTMVRDWIIERLDLEEKANECDTRLFTYTVEAVTKLLPEGIKQALANNALRHDDRYDFQRGSLTGGIYYQSQYSEAIAVILEGSREK